MKVDAALLGVTRLGIDTAPVIYFVELHPRYEPLVSAILQHIASRGLRGVTSVITLGEALVRPIVNSDAPLRAAYGDLLLRSGELETHLIDAATAEGAAELRARYGLRLTDALQVAVAVSQGCEALLTNDVRLKRVTDLRILVLDELEL